MASGPPVPLRHERSREAAEGAVFGSPRVDLVLNIYESYNMTLKLAVYVVLQLHCACSEQ